MSIWCFATLHHNDLLQLTSVHTQCMEVACFEVLSMYIFFG